MIFRRMFWESHTIKSHMSIVLLISWIMHYQFKEFQLSDVEFSKVKMCYLSWNFNEMSLNDIKI